MALGASTYVEAPVGPARRTGLLSVVTVERDIPGNRWYGGTDWYGITGMQVADYRTDPNARDSKTFGEMVDGSSDTFLVYAGLERKQPIGDDTVLGLARRILEGTETVAVEKYLVNQVLTGTGTNVLNSTAVTPDVGLALVEQAMAAGYGGLPLIHADVYLASLLTSVNEALDAAGDGALVTRLGTPVIPGAGYTCTAEIGGVTPGAGESWLFGTGWIRCLGSEVVVNDGRDLASNAHVAVAERMWNVAVEPVVVAALVSDAYADTVS